MEKRRHGLLHSHLPHAHRSSQSPRDIRKPPRHYPTHLRRNILPREPRPAAGHHQVRETLAIAPASHSPLNLGDIIRDDLRLGRVPLVSAKAGEGFLKSGNAFVCGCIL